MKKLAKRKTAKKSPHKRNPEKRPPSYGQHGPKFGESAIDNLLITLRAASEKTTKYSSYYLAVLELVEQDLKDGDVINYDSSVVKTLNYLIKYQDVFNNLVEDMRRNLE